MSPVSRRSILAAVPAAVLAACGRGRSQATTPASSSTPAPTITARAQATAALPAFVRHGPTNSEGVALTFHGSGDVVLLNRLLAVAAAHHAALTIFAVGQWLDATPALASHILASGHELANHTYTHPSLGRMGSAAVEQEITRCRDALARHGKGPGRWFRPSAVVVPSQAILTAAANAGYATVVGYDVDPEDYRDPGAAAVRERVIAGLHPGAIVSLHTGHAGTVDALAGILDAIAARGLQPVTVSRLLV